MIKNRTYYFYNDITDIEAFDSKNIYNIGYITIKKISYGCDTNSVNPLYLRSNNSNGYIEEINENKYLVLDVTYENKELLKRYDDVFNGIMDKIKK